MTRLLLLATALLSSLLFGCAGAGKGGEKETGGGERFAGHWTMGGTFSVFTTNDGRSYSVLPQDMPMDAYQFLSAQPPISHVNSPTGEMWSAYFEVRGKLIPMREGAQSSQLRLHADQILVMDKARPEFLAQVRR